MPNLLSLRFWLACVTAGYLTGIAPSPVAAQAPAKAGKPGLAPEVEIAFREFSKKAADSRRDEVSKAVEKLAGEVAKTVKLDTTAKAKLADLYPSLIAATQAAWQDRFQEWLSPYLQQATDPLETLGQWDPAQLARSRGEVSARPDRTREWSDALRAVLSPAQQEKIETDEKARIEKVKKETGDYLTACESQALEVLTPLMEAEMTQLRQFEKIEEPRMAKLKAAADAAVLEVVKDWRRYHERRMLDMEDDLRDEWLKNRGFPGLDATKSEYQPKQRDAWRKALEEILTPDERTMIASRRAEYRLRRAEALAMVLIEVLERRVGFTGDQRDRLKSLLAKPLCGLPDHYFVSQGANFHSSMNPGQMFALTSSADEARLASVLDAQQLKRWKSLTQRDLNRHYSYSSNEKVEGLEFPPEAEMNETEVRRLLSAYLHRRSSKLIEARRLIMEVKAESIARVAGLGPESRAMLETAAKGAARSLAAEGVRQLEEWARSEFQRIKPADLPAHLKRMNPYFSSRMTGEDPKLWTATVERALSPEQREVWNAELKIADTWKKRCRLALIGSEVEKLILLSPEKRAAFEEILERVLTEYQKDIERMFAFEWHLQGYYSLIPVALMTDEELAPALDKQQITILRSGIPGHFGDTITHLRKSHDERVKAEAKAKTGSGSSADK